MSDQNPAAGSSDERKDEPKRRGGAVGGSPAIADDGDVAFGAMAGIAVIAAILISMLALGGFFNDGSAVSTVAAVDADHADDDHADDDHADDDHSDDDHSDDDHADDEDADHADDEDEEAASVPETTEAPATTEAPETTEAAVADGATAIVEAGGSAITLTGTVPDEATAQAIRDAAARSYQGVQITDELVIEDGAEPFNLIVRGSTTDTQLFNQLSADLGAIGGTAGSFTDELELAESSDLEASLNALDQVLFESGNSVILAESFPVLDEAAALLTANPDVQVEVAGHTDTRGGDADNLTLSQARSAAVVAALVERGVAADALVPQGYGETRPKISPDDTPEDQQANRRIEFRIL